MVQTQPITAPYPELVEQLPVWRVTGRFGTSFTYINVRVAVSSPTTYSAVRNVTAWINKYHSYFPESAIWRTGPHVEVVNRDE